ncbi:MAG: PIN domain nuclease [Acidobacteria bacterium]|nr:PIN domain nuclease [Acidobacteriota bacterium]
MSLWLMRAFLLVVVLFSVFYVHPFGEGNFNLAVSLVVGTVFVVFVVLAEFWIRRLEARPLLGAAIGALVGAIGANMISLVVARMGFNPHTTAVSHILILIAMIYLGVVCGVYGGKHIKWTASSGIFSEDAIRKTSKILDTSVIIDGRVADICKTGFLEGALIVPHFVLRELQQIADSADSAKRNRGRRGLDVLEKIKAAQGVMVQIVEKDYPDVKEVDLKLIELAKEINGKIVTNDFNLNKVAQLRGVDALNINELANSLKPVVLPGETMRVFILKEGKEYNQGVAYLDDGTMVVVDNARRMIGKTIITQVTSVLQTTAGKMIFGRFPDEPETQNSAPQNSRTDRRVYERRAPVPDSVESEFENS